MKKKRKPREPRCQMLGCGAGVARPKCLFELPPNICLRHEAAREYRRKLAEYQKHHD